ncbi:hypothetical protein CAMGR0001_0131 [Campylobacter gracilis RM3268]|uniref:Uncharacterized protein n=1 Tax=Campylobacter gracilis RM3268 TaxID=553220 RepID=C8PKB6_9BACT|nr:hypothetical protein CAMGR0001_0131 [Campylobacter gracilis RM3268]
MSALDIFGASFLAQTPSAALNLNPRAGNDKRAKTPTRTEVKAPNFLSNFAFR